MRRDSSLVCALCVAAVLSAYAAPSNAEATGDATKATPAAGANDKTAETKPKDEPLSKKLDENDGVLKPPQGVDPGIHQAPPAQTGDKMPVIVPPGEPGGDQSVQPK
ncbi:hypothetical protein [Hyphomicrobium sp. 2TAF46]|uniref:hypothetical protein n=1 Tax=Hyphomicrobium sp. 2TAF46 TaxID=3233019 RepID=UPI003F8FEBCF